MIKQIIDLERNTIERKTDRVSFYDAIAWNWLSVRPAKI
jgi:hypothetical protein